MEHVNKVTELLTNTLATTAQTIDKTAEHISSNPATLSITNSGMAAIGAGLAMIGAAGTGVGQGMAVANCLTSMARNPELTSQLRATLIMGLAIIESAAIYCFIISLILVFK